jgi:DNA primase
MIGLCPFHNEKTPSFHVSPAKGIYKCFGCGKGGDSVGFVMEHEKYSYVESLRYLAQKYHIEIEETAPSPEYLAEQSERESLYAITLYAQKFFTQNMMNTEEGKAIGVSYFKERGFTAQTIEKFQLGYAPNQFHFLTDEAVANGYTNNMLLKAGLSAEKDGQIYDRFRQRVIFPIHNLTGRVIGFGGRILTSDKTKAKYINSPETEIYHKSSVLYGIWQAKSKIVSDDNCFLVEGYTDVISMHQAGITNVVSSSGTSLTTEQIKLIKRFTSNITIIYDGDSAGIKASFRGISMILEEGLNVQVLLLPEPEDPDSFVKKNGLSFVLDYIKEKTANFILFKTNLLLAEAAHDPVKKANLVTEIIQDISLIPNPVTRSFYVKECSTLFQIEEQTLNNQLNKIVSQKNLISLLLNHGNQYFTTTSVDEKKQVVKEKHLIAKFVISEIIVDEITFENPLYHTIFYECAQLIEIDETTSLEKHFLTSENVEIKQFAIDIVSSPHIISKNWEDKLKLSTPSIYDEEGGKLNEHVIESVYSLKLRKVEIMIKKFESELKTGPLSEERLIEVLTELKDLIDIKNELSKQLNIIISH